MKKDYIVIIRLLYLFFIRMFEIKEYKELCRIVLIGWKEFITTIGIDLIQKAIETGALLKIDGNLINPSSISYVEPFTGNEIDQFISRITDIAVKERLLKILKERRDKNLITNGIEHLLQIYISRFGQIWTITVKDV